MKLFLFCLSMFLCAGARGELKWEQTTIEVHPAFGARQAVGHFTYANVGQTPVHINSVHASCGCTAAHAASDIVPPGEKGEISVIFNMGDRTGTQLRDVTVQSKDAEHGTETTKLFLKTVIAASLQIQPVLVYWNAGDEPKPKILIVQGSPGSLKSIKVTVTDPVFRVRFQLAGDSQFAVAVQPVETIKAARAMIKIQPEGSSKIFSATAIVTGKPAAAMR